MIQTKGYVLICSISEYGDDYDYKSTLAFSENKEFLIEKANALNEKIEKENRLFESLKDDIDNYVDAFFENTLQLQYDERKKWFKENPIFENIKEFITIIDDIDLNNRKYFDIEKKINHSHIHYFVQKLIGEDHLEFKKLL